MKHLLIIGILILGFFLRITNYVNEPPRGASSDEYTYTFLGQSLLTTGTPTSWSYFPQYQNLGERNFVKIDGILFPLVTPYFDHPPLSGILVGGWTLLNGQDTFSEAELSTMRQIPIILGMITLFLVYVLTLKIYDRKTALFASLIYATSTIIVIETRAVFAENLLTPLFLLTIILLTTLKKSVGYKKIILLSLLSGLSFWTKEVGIVVVFTTLFFLIYEKIPILKIVGYTLVSSVLIGAYFLYGYIYNWELFSVIFFQAQGNREVGYNTLYMLTQNPILINKKFIDGWYLVGFISLFISFGKILRNRFLTIPSFIYLLFLLFSLTDNGEMGWYMIPLFPFFSIITAHLIVEGIRKKNGFIFIVILFIGMYIAQYRIEPKYGLSSIGFRMYLLALFAPLLLAFTLKKEKLVGALSETYFYILVAGTILITYRYIHPL